MDITLLYFPDCPHWRTADERLRSLAAEEPDITIAHIVVDTDEAAQTVGLIGSPTIRIDGADPFADPSAPVGLSCRLFATPTGYAGSPTLEQLRAAVRDSRRSRS